jgi:hypothetical protein
MKSKSWMYILVLVLAALAIMFWRWPVKHTVTLTPITQTDKVWSSNAANIALLANNTNVSLKEKPINPISPAQIQTANTRLELYGRDLELKNVPINFYGKVIDQDGNGIVGVQIALRVRQWHLDAKWGNTFPKYDRTTDSNGDFSFEDSTGDSLTIESVAKDGYRLSPRAQTGFGYGRVPIPFHPDPQNPVILKMWREFGTKEPLITGNHIFGVDSGKTYTLDLIHGKKIEGEVDGDLLVSITRPNEVNSRDRYPWSYSIEAIHGGLIETDDEFMYLAPESGYELKFVRQFDPTDSDWNLDVAKQFFIRTRDGQVYGRVQVQIHSVYNIHSAIEVNYAVNPNSSRNLQP